MKKKNKETKITEKLYTEIVKEEWRRLVKSPYHRLEFDTSLYFLEKHLPKKGTVLDAGGGPGRYTVELAKRGYEVTLLDLVSANLDFAKKKVKREKISDKVKDFVQGSITDLSEFPDNSFDAVLCLGGPLSHVSPEKEREKAVSELVRVAKKNAPIFISVMSRYGVLLSTPGGWPEEAENKKNLWDLIEKGEDYRFCGGRGYCHFFTSKEMEEMFLKEDVRIIAKVGIRGLNIDKKTANMFAKKFPKAWKNWVEVSMQMCTDPVVVDTGSHMMFVIKKSGGKKKK